MALGCDVFESSHWWSFCIICRYLYGTDIYKTFLEQETKGDYVSHRFRSSLRKLQPQFCSCWGVFLPNTTEAFPPLLIFCIFHGTWSVTCGTACVLQKSGTYHSFHVSDWFLSTKIASFDTKVSIHVLFGNINCSLKLKRFYEINGFQDYLLATPIHYLPLSLYRFEVYTVNE